MFNLIINNYVNLAGQILYDNTVGDKKCIACSVQMSDCNNCTSISVCIKCFNNYLTTSSTGCITSCSLDVAYYIYSGYSNLYSD